MRLRAALALAVVVVAGAAVVFALTRGGGGGGERPAGLEVALQDDAVFTHRYYYDRERAFQQARQLGVSWLRITVVWHSAAGDAPAPGAVRWQFGQYDDAVDAARAHGLRVEMTLAGPAPGWATGDGRVGVVRPDAPAFGTFARAVASHFRGRVSRYSIWNEPNYVAWLRPLAEAPQLYRALYLFGRAAVKEVDPSAQVLIGETAAYGQPRLATPPLSFLRAVSCAGCPRLVADGYAHHPYEYANNFLEAGGRPSPDDATIDHLDRLESELASLAHAGRLSDPDGRPLDLYLTEFGYFERGRRALPAGERAARLRSAFEAAARAYPRVRQLLQYELVAPPPASPGGGFDTALVSLSGAPSPAFRALASWAAGALRMQRIAAPP